MPVFDRSLYTQDLVDLRSCLERFLSDTLGCLGDIVPDSFGLFRAEFETCVLLKPPCVDR